MQGDLLRAAQAEQSRLESILNLHNQALQQATVAAAEADGARTQLMTHISHDLRAPMNAIMGYADLIARGGGQSREQALNILRSSKNMLMQISGLIQSARGGAHAPTLHPQPLDVSAFLRRVARFASQAARRHDNRFCYHVAKALPDVVEVDAKRLRQVLEYLLTNAAEFTRSGCIELSVDYQAPDDPAKNEPLAFVFTVRDTGPGIQQKALAAVFDPVQMLDHICSPARQGLGLAVTHRWVLRMGGRLEETSQPGQGTAMHVFLPLMPSRKAAAPREPVRRDEGAPARFQGAEGLKLLSAFKVIRRLSIKKSKPNRTQAIILKQTLQAIARLQESIRVCSREVDDAVLSGYENQQARTHLLSLVSTRLRVPVDNIIREAERMVCPDKGEAAQQEIILRSALRLRGLVNNLIKVSKPDADLQLLAHPEVPISALPTGTAPLAQRAPTLNNHPVDVFPEPEILAHVSDLLKMGAVTDLMEWANRADARHARWSRFAGMVAELAANGDLQGLANLLQTSNPARTAPRHEVEMTP